MILKDFFGNVFGIIWLIIFILFCAFLFVYIIVKSKRQESAVVKKEEKKEIKVIDEYEIVESSDGFYRVKKTSSDRTIRKFSTLKEAKKYLEEKENDRS